MERTRPSLWSWALLIGFLFLPIGWGKECPNCSVDLPEASRFCAQCGHRFTPQKVCPDCSQQVFGEARFCPECGHRFAHTPEDEERFLMQTFSARNQYRNNLLVLEEFYRSLGMHEQAKKVRQEMDSMEHNIQIHPPQEVGTSPDDQPAPIKFQSIEEADQIFEEAERWRKNVNPFKRKYNLAKALEEYNKLLLRHPQSDKADDTAYRIAEIYESVYMQNFEKAIEYFKKCYHWNPQTERDARYRAAHVADYELHDTHLAMPIYEEAAKNDPIPENKQKASERLARLRR
jgi:tetratricopeptide (TPR) repeat protein